MPGFSGKREGERMGRGALILAVVAAAFAATIAAAQDFKDGLVKSGTLTVGTSGSAPP